LTVVLDSSAMIAWLQGEPEGVHVDALLSFVEEGEGEVFAHSANLCEVFYRAMASATREDARNSITLLRDAGVQERNDLDVLFWEDMATTIAKARTLFKADGTKATLALGDAFGVCLANRLSAEFVTKDRSEIEPLHDAGMVVAGFIR